MKRDDTKHPTETDGNIASHLSRMAKTQPQQLAVACPASGFWAWTDAFSELSFKELDDWSDHIARGFIKAGIGKGTRVVLLVPPGPEFFALVFALMKCGAIMICIDPGIGLGAMGRCINHSRPKVIIGSRKAHLARRFLGWGRNSNRLNIHTVSTPLITLMGPQKHHSLAAITASGRQAGALALPTVKAEDSAAILFTSGSTGSPKGVVYTHGTFQAQVRILRDCYDIMPGEVDLSTFPLFALFAPALGMSAVVPKMNFTRPAAVRPRKIIQAVNRYGVTSMFGSPALLQRLGRWNRRHHLTLPSLRRVISAGAPVHASVLEDLTPMLGTETPINTPYGATEVLPVTTITGDEILAQTAAMTARGMGICVGRPVAEVQIGIIEIASDAMADADPDWQGAGVIGEIVASGPNLSKGYDGLIKAQHQARFHDSQGRHWHRMGDTGYIDDQGRLWFCGRIAHCVFTPNEAFFPIPCEGVFNSHPQVYRSALIRLKQGKVSRPGLCVELEAGVPGAAHQRISAELLEIGAAFEHTHEIRDVFFHPAFPVDIRHNAKIDRERLSHWASAKL